ncbi:glucocorticoid modulatory element-binding protein 1-like isoform X2 [Sphaeramia orbicularis]|nr:glucocorticoid modulatory element-binding protein 1-like isoform X2 [Sphaeramia orbicularis]
MEGAEVTLSSGDLMMVKEEEGETSGNQKTEVILHLEPILPGVNSDTADTGTTVLAIEAHHNDSKAEGEEIEYGYPITCGDSRAVLLFKKFVCPGINVRCVKFNDQLISPKQFVHLAGKATLKDWKRAIRLGGVMLRKMMDSGQIDFYQHDTVCSNTCRSTKFDVLINSTRLPPGTSVQPSPSCLALDPVGGQVPLLTAEVLHDAAEAEESLEDSLTAEWSPGPARPVNPTRANGHTAKRKRSDTPDGVLNLWKCVADSGLMGEVLSSLQTELLATFKGVEVRCEKTKLQEKDAIILNSLCEMFGLLESVKQAVELRRSHNEENKIHNNIYVLDETLEATFKPTSSKHPRNQRHSPSNDQTLNATSSVVQPFSIIGLSAASLAERGINPLHFTHFSACISAGQDAGQPLQMTDRLMDGDSRGVKLERKNDQSETGNREKSHRRQEGVKREDTSGIYKEAQQRTVQFHEDPHLKDEEMKNDSVHDIHKVVVLKKALKKHKTK